MDTAAARQGSGPLRQRTAAERFGDLCDVSISSSGPPGRKVPPVVVPLSVVDGRVGSQLANLCESGREVSGERAGISSDPREEDELRSSRDPAVHHERSPGDDLEADISAVETVVAGLKKVKVPPPPDRLNRIATMGWGGDDRDVAELDQVGLTVIHVEPEMNLPG